ncbi:trehalose-phosphatase [Herbiconiux sp. CPCC 205716]|uniref:Trehalose 6-phosphate phosphatase n=1 Tax=Herbiconiux gentiana TaxID=2970912 RepID=A0ABT2GM59_9MICO|nr:trehalose-phosphatase [Herbiconiux gentiana]MCS5716355.1 trehalose-phosphatase [Herbiconiux gentiana]
MTGAPTSAVLQRLASTEVLLVALDFDGTLAPIVDVPADARALPEASAAVLALLDLPGTHVAYVSGRAMDSLAAVSDLPDEALLAGSHGVEVRTDGRVELDLSDTERAERERLGPLLADIAEPLDGVWIEEKPAGFAIHTRLADEAATARAEEQALAAADAEAHGITVRHGQDILEFSVRGTTKGDAVSRLREHTGSTAVLFAGDDVTDEDGFGALSGDDVGVKVGSGATSAAFRVDGPAEMAAVLAELGVLRRDRGA